MPGSSFLSTLRIDAGRRDLQEMLRGAMDGNRETMVTYIGFCSIARDESDQTAIPSYYQTIWHEASEFLA
ncbi:MAG TPA: hypothetical protein VMR28_02005 [Candidatus Saccharimonadales bacterium]|nr:hypothetical protein [Candidatus Saccharimonadales bacterium]